MKDEKKGEETKEKEIIQGNGNNTTEEARENRIEKSPSWMSDGAPAKEGEDRVRDGDATKTEEYVR